MKLGCMNGFKSYAAKRFKHTPLGRRSPPTVHLLAGYGGRASCHKHDVVEISEQSLLL